MTSRKHGYKVKEVDGGWDILSQQFQFLPVMNETYISNTQRRKGDTPLTFAPYAIFQDSDEWKCAGKNDAGKPVTMKLSSFLHQYDGVAKQERSTKESIRKSPNRDYPNYEQQIIDELKRLNSKIQDIAGLLTHLESR